MNFKVLENEYKPLQLWAWNEKLSSEYTIQHTHCVNSSGLGGFCISAQSGLSTRYMGDEWFRNMNSAIAEAKRLGLSVFISDEHGYPTGSGNGFANSLSLENQQKFLRFEPGEGTNDRTIVYKDGYHFYYDINPCFIDFLNPEATSLFISEAYAPFSDKLVEKADVLFSWDPQLSDGLLPWSFTLPAAYKDAYGEELLDVLPELFRPVGDYQNTRIKFWSLITKLFSENFIKPIRNWCHENQIKHLALLNCNNASAFISHGSPMMQFANTDIPAIEVFSKEETNPLPALMASSVTHQFGKETSIAFLFSSAGHSSTYADIKCSASAQFARGIGKICISGNSSSLRGFRKRNLSTAGYLREELNAENRLFNEYISRTGKALSFGIPNVDTLLLSNYSSLWANCNGGYNDNIENCYNEFRSCADKLEKKHIPFHIGDELIMKEYAYIDNDALCIGKMRYKTIVLPENTVFSENTKRLLSEFEHAGGFIVIADSIPKNSVCDNENLLYTSRICNDCSIHYFFNNSQEEFTSAITAGTKMLDLVTGDIVPFYGVYKFNPYESIIVINDNTPEIPRPFKKPLKTLDISGEWKLESMSQNVLVLDKCSLYTDGEISYENINVCDVTEILYSLKTPVSVCCKFSLNVDSITSSLYLACESPQNFIIEINGAKLEKEFFSSYLDRAFPLFEITPHLSVGENEICIKTEFIPSEECINSRELSQNYKSELNRFNYDVEFEPVYIVGDFSVKTNGEFRKLDKNAFRYIGEFSIDSLKTEYTAENLEMQGLPFFQGEITLSKSFNLSDTQYCFKFNPKGVSSVKLEINGQKMPPVLWAPYEFDLSDLLVKGDNEIKLTLSAPLRNLLGPHHIPMGELYTVIPSDFYRHTSVWNKFKETPWDENYCFIEFGISSEKEN